jgi:hypothetical protein
MIDVMVSSSDGVAVAASAGKFPEGGPTRYQAAFETAARKLDGTRRAGAVAQSSANSNGDKRF